ncbi:DMT family transporter [Rhodobacteraceae bacterium RKSG542]|uniref:DMT family transporter n=1 Tax=Pseudovibrio flavus TaxID=2529854 RepID=UPI0012BB81AC|nr:DMT family transporter [Pseudovibrio flavus]MTI18610.1 DMT family transporter [Pseudovibrio flavus]
MSQMTSSAAAVRPSSVALQGILLMTIAMLLGPIIDGIAKYLTYFYAPVLVAFLRYVGQGFLALCVALALRKDILALLREFDMGQFWRGACIALSSVFFFVALKYVPLADAIAIFFVQPLILTALSAVVLKEKVDAKRWGAVVVGLIGAMVIIQPGTGAFSAYSILPVIAATFFAVYLLLTRRLSGQGTVLGVQISTSIAGLLALAPILIVGTMTDYDLAIWTTPSLEHLWAILALGFVSLSAHGIIILAFDRTPASVLAPLNYVSIVSATIFGVVVFGDWPEPTVWIGVSLIIAGGIYIAYSTRDAIDARQDDIPPMPAE